MLAFIVKLRFRKNISGSKPANVAAIQFQVDTKHERKPAIDCVARSLAPCHEAGALILFKPAKSGGRDLPSIISSSHN